MWLLPQSFTGMKQYYRGDQRDKLRCRTVGDNVQNSHEFTLKSILFFLFYSFSILFIHLQVSLSSLLFPFLSKNLLKHHSCSSSSACKLSSYYFTSTSEVHKTYMAREPLYSHPWNTAFPVVVAARWLVRITKSIQILSTILSILNILGLLRVVVPCIWVWIMN